VQSSYQHLANLQNAHITSTSGQLARTQRSNENIVGELTKLKIGLFEAESSLRGDDGEGRVREELGKQRPSHGSSRSWAASAACSPPRSSAWPRR
jgi:hypothetical protein